MCASYKHIDGDAFIDYMILIYIININKYISTHTHAHTHDTHDTNTTHTTHTTHSELR